VLRIHHADIGNRGIANENRLCRALEAHEPRLIDSDADTRGLHMFSNVVRGSLGGANQKKR
jgi:hypothetical protein